MTKPLAPPRTFRSDIATSVSADVPRLLKALQLDHLAVFGLTLELKTASIINLRVDCELNEAQLKDLVEEMEARPPVKSSLDGLKYSLN